MEKLSWTEELSVNVKEIDAQHIKLVDFINDVSEKLESKNFEGIETFFETLKKHADEHFSTEENYFDKFNFEKTGEHVQKHNEIKTKLDEYEARFVESKSLDVISELLNFLKDWFFGHIMDFDKKYVKCFNEHGLY